MQTKITLLDIVQLFVRVLELLAIVDIWPITSVRRLVLLTDLLENLEDASD